MKLLLLILFLTATVFSQQAELLEKAYKYNSQIIVEEFFYNWQNEIMPITKDELENQNDTVKSIYEIYDVVFNAVNKMNNDSNKYWLLSDKIYIKYVDIFISKFWKEDSAAYKFLSIVDPKALQVYDTIPDIWYIYKSPNIIREYSLLNFRPLIKGKKNVIYLNDAYEKIITYFISRDQTSIRFSNISDYGNLNAHEVCRRLDFLSNNLPFRCVPIEYQGVLYYSNYRIMSAPAITHIDFANNFQTAQAYFSYDACTYEVYLIRENNKWVFLKYKATLCA